MNNLKKKILTTQVLPYILRLAKARFSEKKKRIFVMKYLKIYWLHFVQGKACWSRSQWPRGLRRCSVAVRLWARIPPRQWMFFCCECCVLSGRGLCDELITRPEESYGCLSVVSVVCCQVEVCATSWSLVQSNPMDVCLLWELCVVW